MSLRPDCETDSAGITLAGPVAGPEERAAIRADLARHAGTTLGHAEAVRLLAELDRAHKSEAAALDALALVTELLDRTGPETYASMVRDVLKRAGRR